jgi:hypothetical protein
MKCMRMICTNDVYSLLHVYRREHACIRVHLHDMLSAIADDPKVLRRADGQPVLMEWTEFDLYNIHQGYRYIIMIMAMTFHDISYGVSAKVRPALVRTNKHVKIAAFGFSSNYIMKKATSYFVFYG